MGPTMTPRYASSSALLDQCLAHLDNLENLLVREMMTLMSELAGIIALLKTIGKEEIAARLDEQVREMMTLRSELAGIITGLKTIGEEEIAAHLGNTLRSESAGIIALLLLGLGARLLARADDARAIVRLELATIIALQNQ